MRSEFDALLRTPTGRRAFLKYMAMAGGMGVLAACRKNVTAGGGSTASGSARPPLEAEPGVLKAYEWAGFEVEDI
jgi:hypothetical protein